MNHQNHYMRLLGMTVLSFISMYILMYAMVDRFDNVFNSVNQVYMAGLMSAPMVLIELVLMSQMYENRRLNVAIGALAVVALVGFFLLIRYQTGVGDRQFLRSMIPHHAGAVLMCQEGPARSAEINELCRNIIASQQDEIARMKEMLAKQP